MPYLYDRAGGLARVVDDGTDGFVHGPAGLLEEVGSSATTWESTERYVSEKAVTIIPSLAQ
jgi:hypothetical protein